MASIWWFSTPYSVLYLYLYSVLTPVSSSAVVTDTDHSIDNKHGSLMTTRFGYQAGRNWSVSMPYYIPLYHRTTIWPFCRLILQVTAADDYLCIHYAGVRLRSTYSAVVMEFCLYGVLYGMERLQTWSRNVDQDSRHFRFNFLATSLSSGVVFIIMNLVAYSSGWSLSATQSG